jgi:hypothetical protein
VVLVAHHPLHRRAHRLQLRVPYVVAEEPTEYWDGLFDSGDGRDAHLRSVRALLTIIREQVTAFGGVELYPVWDGNEHLPPKGIIEVFVHSLDAETFLFTEQFFYRVVREPGSHPAGRTDGTGE